MEESIKVFNRVLLFAGITIFDKNKQNSWKWIVFQFVDVLIGLITFIFTTTFVLSNASDLLVCIQGTSIWATGVIMFISLGICSLYRKEFSFFLEEMVFADHMLEMPLIALVLQMQVKRGKLKELKKLVISSQKNLFKLTRLLLISYVFAVWLSATLYLCSPIYRMSVRKDDSLRLLGKISIA